VRASKPKPTRSAFVTIGVFDGVHLGHQALLAAARRAARRHGGTPAVVTFRPPPARVLFPRTPLGEITPWRMKRTMLEAMGIARILPLHFTRVMASMAPEVFVREILLREFDLAGLILGYDFRFGARGSGNAALLRRMGRVHGFRVRLLPAVLFEGAPLSSTRIRAAIAQGAVDRAAAMIGRPFAIRGRVIAGRGLGTRYFVPTANVLPARTQLLPAPGVYLTRVRHGGRTWGGVAHVGGAPTLGGPVTAPIEVHLLGFAGTLLGRCLTVEFLERHRESRRFRGGEQLRRAIGRDVRWAERAFSGRRENRLASPFPGC
jgi:riboflavin kinase/FMN adenylyltransferase